jgi:gluconate 5-dehydrogenase
MNVKMSGLFDLSGRIALVTGSSAGIGSALAFGLGRAGARVVLNGRQQDKVAIAAQKLRDDGSSVFEMPFDVTDSTAVKAAVEQIEGNIGPIDILINNAGMQRRGPLEDYPEETWHELMTTNVDSVFYMSQAVARSSTSARFKVNSAALRSRPIRQQREP